MSAKEKLVTFARLILGRKAIIEAIESVQDFVGCEVLEQAPTGLAVAIITQVEWDSTVLPAGWQKGQPQGDWIIKIRYIATGWESWTNQSDLMLTGTRYEDIEAVMQQAHKTQKRMAVAQ
jgi:hypothetical protein